jgi:hypothetical protein
MKMKFQTTKPDRLPVWRSAKCHIGPTSKHLTVTIYDHFKTVRKDNVIYCRTVKLRFVGLRSDRGRTYGKKKQGFKKTHPEDAAKNYLQSTPL